MGTMFNNVEGELHFTLPYKPSKVVTKENASDLFEIIGAMRLMAESYEGNSSTKNAASYVKRLAHRLESIALDMMEECK